MERELWPLPFDLVDPESADENIGSLMKRVRNSIAEAADKRLEPQGITRAQMGPLYVLRSARASTVAQIARELHIDPGSMTRMLDRLEAKGLCRRLRSSDDRRVVRVELTPDGEIAADRLVAELAHVMNGHLAGFSNEEWVQLKRFLQRMLRNADALFASGTK